jgi:hypothetical protein
MGRGGRRRGGAGRGRAGGLRGVRLMGGMVVVVVVVVGRGSRWGASFGCLNMFSLKGLLRLMRRIRGQSGLGRWCLEFGPGFLILKPIAHHLVFF